MTDHHELISEMPSIERMATQDRLKHAKKRRSQQLKKFTQYEKHLDKEHSKKRKSGHTHQDAKKQKRKKRNVIFVPNISLLEAAARNDVEEVKSLLEKGVKPDLTNDDGLTAIHQCCIDDSEEMLKLLLEYGANVNAQDSEHWTPLHAAATCGHAHLCHHLIDNGADLLAVNADGNMPYDICEDDMTLDYIETEMAKRGITQDEIDDKRLASEKYVLEDLEKIKAANKSLEFRDHVGATPLHIAAANGYLQVAQYLLDNHVAVDIRDNDSWQPIHAAAYWGQPDLVDILVQNGADIDAKTKSGETPFDLCEDPELKQKILDVKDEIETNRASRGGKSSNIKHRISSRSASLRRSSLRGDKGRLSLKEAKEEALHFGLRMLQDEEDLREIDEDKENVPATNIDDVEIMFNTEEESKHHKNDKHPHHNDQKSKTNNHPTSTSSSKSSKAHPESISHTGDKTKSHSIDNRHPKSAPVSQPATVTNKPHHVTRIDSNKPSNNQSKVPVSQPKHQHQPASQQTQPKQQPAPKQQQSISVPKQQPAAPKQQQPAAPKQQQPAAPKQQQPAAPKQQQQQPAAPKQQQQQPAAPKQQQQQPAVSKQQQPADTKQQQPVAPKQQPAAPKQQQPSPPKQHQQPAVPKQHPEQTQQSSSSNENAYQDDDKQNDGVSRQSLASSAAANNNSGTLNDLKRHRAGNRKDNLDAHVQSMFVERANQGWHNPYSPNSKTSNGHNNNNTYSQETKKRFVAPSNAAIVGEDEKTNCCVVM